MTATKETRYIEGVGRRKTSIARARITPSSKTSYKINNKDLDTYFPTLELKKIVESPINKTKAGEFAVTVVLKGGGVHSQAEALRQAISRALVKKDLILREKLKKAGYLKRDPRAKERRKFGLKKARKAPQWSKR